MLDDQIKVTGYGPTPQAAEADAQRKLNDARMDRQEAALVGTAAGAFSIGIWTVIFGFLSFAWALFLSFSVRPLVTIIVGSLILVPMYFLARYVINKSFDSGWAIIVIPVTLLICAALLGETAKSFKDFTANFEHVELNFFSSLPFLIRSPLMITLIGWPLLFPAWAIYYNLGNSWQGFSEYMATTPWYDHLLIFVMFLVLQGIVLYARLEESSLSNKFTWYGAIPSRGEKCVTEDPRGNKYKGIETIATGPDIWASEEKSKLFADAARAYETGLISSQTYRRVCGVIEKHGSGDSNGCLPRHIEDLKQRKKADINGDDQAALVNLRELGLIDDDEWEVVTSGLDAAHSASEQYVTLTDALFRLAECRAITMETFQRAMLLLDDEYPPQAAKIENFPLNAPGPDAERQSRALYDANLISTDELQHALTQILRRRGAATDT